MEGGVVFEHRQFTAPRTDRLSSSWRSTHRVVLTETGGTARTWVAVEGRTIYDGFDRPGALTFVPALVERTSSYRDADLSFSCIWISPTILSSLSTSLQRSPLHAVINGNDEVVSTLLKSLSSAVAAGREPGSVYVEHLAALALLRMAGMRPDEPRRMRASKLNQKALGRVLAYIDANLATDIRLSDLAGLLELPMDTFARRFRATIGHAPYGYVQRTRVQRAAELLRATDTNICSVALATGFSSQSHFTSVFKHLTGTTPRRYRMSYRPGS
jgi:AraC family transcriptional regulator